MNAETADALTAKYTAKESLVTDCRKTKEKTEKVINKVDAQLNK